MGIADQSVLESICTQRLMCTEDSLCPICRRVRDACRKWRKGIEGWLVSSENGGTETERDRTDLLSTSSSSFLFSFLIRKHI